MLWFNLEDVICLEDNALFQYILCCGSTKFDYATESYVFYFNTSYVVVQPFGTRKK